MQNRIWWLANFPACRSLFNGAGFCVLDRLVVVWVKTAIVHMYISISSGSINMVVLWMTIPYTILSLRQVWLLILGTVPVAECLSGFVSQI